MILYKPWSFSKIENEQFDNSVMLVKEQTRGGSWKENGREQTVRNREIKLAFETGTDAALKMLRNLRKNGD